jgi:hypothetical protein
MSLHGSWKTIYKSVRRLSHGLVGTCKGLYRPCFLLLHLLVKKIMYHVMNQAISSCILGQYTYIYKFTIILPTPK